MHILLEVSCLKKPLKPRVHLALMYARKTFNLKLNVIFPVIYSVLILFSW